MHPVFLVLCSEQFESRCLAPSSWNFKPGFFWQVSLNKKKRGQKMALGGTGFKKYNDTLWEGKSLDKKNKQTTGSAACLKLSSRNTFWGCLSACSVLPCVNWCELVWTGCSFGRQQHWDPNSSGCSPNAPEHFSVVRTSSCRISVDRHKFFLLSAPCQFSLQPGLCWSLEVFEVLPPATFPSW